MNKSNNCLFCKIINGSLPSTKVYEDEHTLAFLNINPEGPEHTLVVPKACYRNIYDCPPNILHHVINTTQKIAVELSKKYPTIRIVQNNEAPIQEIFHFHFHVIPYKDKNK